MSKSSTIVPFLLDEDNYEDWSIYIKNYLKSQHLWGVVEHGDATEWLSSGDEAIDWEKKNFAALHVIQISCCPKYFARIKKIESPKNAWEKLATIHQENAGDETIDMAERVDCVDVAKSISKGDWGGVKQFADKHAISTTFINGNQTALQVAISVRQDKIAEQLIEMMSETDLEIMNSSGYRMALTIAAFQGSLSIVKCLVQKNNKLLTIQDKTGFIPIFHACNAGHAE